MGKKKKRPGIGSKVEEIPPNLCTSENVAYLVEAFGRKIEPMVVATVLSSVEDDLDR